MGNRSECFVMSSDFFLGAAGEGGRFGGQIVRLRESVTFKVIGGPWYAMVCIHKKK
jgi:hypothetical protein